MTDEVVDCWLGWLTHQHNSKTSMVVWLVESQNMKPTDERD
jgi:hypothetical protein